MEKEQPPRFIIREATDSDVETIRRMHAQSWLDTYPNEAAGVPYDWVKEETDSWLTSEKLAATHEHFGKVLHDPSQFYRIAVSDGIVIGLVHGITKDNGTKHLGALYVDKAFHGRGVAQTLMEYVDEWFASSDVDLEVVTYNERAKAFYRKYGFEEIIGSNATFKEKIPVITMMRKKEK